MSLIISHQRFHLMLPTSSSQPYIKNSKGLSLHSIEKTHRSNAYHSHLLQKMNHIFHPIHNYDYQMFSKTLHQFLIEDLPQVSHRPQLYRSQFLLRRCFCLLLKNILFHTLSCLYSILFYVP